MPSRIPLASAERTPPLSSNAGKRSKELVRPSDPRGIFSIPMKWKFVRLFILAGLAVAILPVMIRVSPSAPDATWFDTLTLAPWPSAFYLTVLQAREQQNCCGSLCNCYFLEPAGIWCRRLARMENPSRFGLDQSLNRIVLR